eukprot:5631752-Prymnesium_polylepis.1
MPECRCDLFAVRALVVRNKELAQQDGSQIMAQQVDGGIPSNRRTRRTDHCYRGVGPLQLSPAVRPCFATPERNQDRALGAGTADDTRAHTNDNAVRRETFILGQRGRRQAALLYIDVRPVREHAHVDTIMSSTCLCVISGGVETPLQENHSISCQVDAWVHCLTLRVPGDAQRDHRRRRF